MTKGGDYLPWYFVCLSCRPWYLTDQYPISNLLWLQEFNDFSINTQWILIKYRRGSAWINKESNDTKVNDPVILDSSNIQLLVVVTDSMINTLRVWITRIKQSSDSISTLATYHCIYFFSSIENLPCEIFSFTSTSSLNVPLIGHKTHTVSTTSP